MTFSRFLTIGELRKIINGVPDNTVIGTFTQGKGLNSDLDAERWRFVQHKETRQLGFIIGDESVGRILDKSDDFHGSYKVLLADPSYDVRNADESFRREQNKTKAELSVAVKANSSVGVQSISDLFRDD